jgi:hypothetical protein
MISKREIPSLRLQTPGKIQTFSIQREIAPVGILDLDNWDLFGPWSLGFGI